MKMFNFNKDVRVIKHGICHKKKKNLLECLSHFQSVVEKRNTIPILSNVKVSALQVG